MSISLFSLHLLSISSYSLHFLILSPFPRDKLQEKGIFNTWMLQEQDLIQAFAKSYADRIICEAFRETLAGQFGPVDPSLSGVLGSVFHLHLLNSVEKDLSTFLASDLLNSSQAEQVDLDVWYMPNFTWKRRWSRRLGDSALSSPQAHLLSLSPSAFLRRCFSHPLPLTG